MSKLTKALKDFWYTPGWPARPAPFLVTVVASAGVPAALAVSPVMAAFAGVAAAGSFAYTMISNPRGKEENKKAPAQLQLPL